LRRSRDSKAVGARVDWLELSFRVELSEHALRILRARAASAVRADAPASVAIGRAFGGAWKLHPPARQGKWLLQNALARATVLERGPGAEGEACGWTLRVEVSGIELGAMGWRKAIAEGWTLARELGVVHEGRFGRTDLCVDVADFDLRADDRRAFIKQRRVRLKPVRHDGEPHVSRKKKTDTQGETHTEQGVVWGLSKRNLVRLIPDGDGGVLAEMHAGDTFTGFQFGTRTAVTCRLYDKRLELRAQSPDKRESEETWWKSNGWDGKADVTRIEFEFRGEALDELRMRCATRDDDGPDAHAERFAAMVDETWAYATHKWLRLARRGEPDVVQPRWRIVQGAVFVAAAEPRERRRVRGAAKAAQAEGACMSLLGVLGELPDPSWLPRSDPDTGEVDSVRPNADEAGLVAELCGDDPERAKAQLFEDVEAIAQRAAFRIAYYELDKANGDPKKALERVWCKWRATLARFSPGPPDDRANACVA